MTKRQTLVAAALFLGAATAWATDGSASLEPGDRVRGDLSPGDVDTIRFTTVAGALLDLRLEADEDPPALSLVLPSGGAPVSLQTSGSGGRRKLRGFRLEETGRYELRLTGAGDDTNYELELDARSPRTARNRGETDGEGAATLLLGAFPAGTELRIVASGGTVAAVEDPTGPLVIAPGRRVAARVLATGSVSVRIEGRADRRIKVRARAKPVKRAGEDREVVDDPVPGGGGGGGDDDVDARVAGLVVVRLRDGAEEEELEDRHGSKVVELVPGTGFLVLEVPEGKDDDDFLEELGDDDDCVDKEPVLVSESPEGGQSSVAFTSSDAARQDVLDQAGFAAVRASSAAALTRGAGVLVAILDTGVNASHPDLAGRLEAGWDFIDDDANPADEPNGIDDDGDLLVDEGVGHGTFVAGLVATLAPDARILPVRVLNSDARGSTLVVARGIVYAVDHGAKVINLSLGLRRNSALLQDALSYAKDNEVLVVASAGNRGQTGTVDFPAGLSDVLTVSAVNAAGVRPAFANASSKVDLVAPGVDILAPHAAANYATWSGTSFAAPFATAGVALVLSKNPGTRPRKAGDLLEETAVSVSAQNPGTGNVLGKGRIDLLKAVQEKP